MNPNKPVSGPSPHDPAAPPVPSSGSSRTELPGDPNPQGAVCERADQGACSGKVEYRDEIQTEEDYTPFGLLCDHHWSQQLDEYGELSSRNLFLVH